MNWDRIERWEYVVEAVSAEYHKKFPICDYEDIKQALYKWFIEHPNKLDTWEAIGDKDAKNLIYRSLRNEALDYCQRWKAKTVGYDVSDLYYYEPALVEILLPTVLMGNFHIAPKLNLSGSSRPSAPAEGGNVQVMLLEVDSAYWKLSKEDRKLLFFRHAESLDFKEIANYLSLGTEDAARMRHKRAIQRLVNKLGGRKPYLDDDLDSPEKTGDNEHSEQGEIESNHGRYVDTTNPSEDSEE
jgi:DNA-directed RNA polymerase specialized sigma24 family protein